MAWCIDNDAMDLASDLADAANTRTTVTTAMMPMSGAESAMETRKVFHEYATDPVSEMSREAYVKNPVCAAVPIRYPIAGTKAANESMATRPFIAVEILARMIRLLSTRFITVFMMRSLFMLMVIIRD